MSTFEQTVLELGPKPAISKGTISPERRAFDKAFIASLDGGIACAGLPIYHPKRAKKAAAPDAGTEFLRESRHAAE
jgi:hypothetical protein